MVLWGKIGREMELGKEGSAPADRHPAQTEGAEPLCSAVITAVPTDPIKVAPASDCRAHDGELTSVN